MIDFSIITPVYNGEAFISETIESVISNLDPNLRFEYLIIDDGSTDNTKTILDVASSQTFAMDKIKKRTKAEVNLEV